MTVPEPVPVTEYDLEITQGETYSTEIVLPGSKLIWPSGVLAAQIRPKAHLELALDLGAHIAISFEADDMVIKLSIPGRVTETMRAGEWSAIISDVTGDRQAIVITGDVKVQATSTKRPWLGVTF